MVLLYCFLYSVTVKGLFTATDLLNFMHNLFKFNLTKSYLSLLIDSKLLIITQVGNHKFYSLTDLGYSAIKEISDNSDKLLYSFCEKYSIVL